MDSTNSGSIHSSSSGGDDYYDSRAEAISSFLILPSRQPPPPPPASSSQHLHHHHHPSPSSFISLSPRVKAFPTTPPDPNPLSLDMTWAKSLPPSSLSEPSCTILDGLTTTTTTSSSSSKTMAAAALGRSPHSDHSSLHPSSVQLPTHPGPPAATPRGSKKRSRASRRAPTTVLTTDASNFRAMVQEFTGFPAAPFISSPFSRPRLDLFHATTTPPPYLLGPFAQKLQAPLFAPISSYSSSSSMADVAASITRNSVANANAGTTSTCRNSSPSSPPSSIINYQLPSFVLQHPNLLNMQGSNFTFQSSLQPPTTPNHNSSTMPAFGSNPPLAPSDLASTGGLGSLITMEGVKLSSRADGNYLGWADGSAPEGRDQSQLRSVIGNYGNLQLVGSHAEKGSENMTLGRSTEGRVDMDSFFRLEDLYCRQSGRDGR